MGQADAWWATRARAQVLADPTRALARALLRRSQADLLATRNLLELTGHASAEARLAALLHDFAAAASESSCHLAKHFDLPLTRGEIANMLGLTIETVSRQMTKLRQMGVIDIHNNRHVMVGDVDRLRDLCG